MALPMLINGADCGPSNPLQGLTKNIDHDRGLQQDFFGGNRAGSSRETFRTGSAPAPSLGREVSQFFGHPARAPQHQFSGPSPFDLSKLNAALPSVSSTQPQQHSRPPTASWATDFLTQSPQAASPPPIQSHMKTSTTQQNQSHPDPGLYNQMSYQQPTLPMLSMNHMRTVSPPTQAPASFSSQLDASSLDQAFSSHEASLSQGLDATPATEQAPVSRPQYDDELARTAADIINAVSREENPKFKNSQFLGLMRQLRDHDVVIEGNEMVQISGSGRTSVDVKGKGKAVDFAHPPTTIPAAGISARKWVGQQPLPYDPNEAYFGAENEEYAQYWSAHHSAPERTAVSDNQGWDALQKSWDEFEATSAGLRPAVASGYHFQENNPYLLGERSYHHSMHDAEHPSFLESVLQLEATVQREPTNAGAWFNLGVKQQENERETQALQALRRAVALDPEHLPSWLALATSSTNEGLRQHTIGAVREWILRNQRYTNAVAAYGEPGETLEGLVSCLLAMVRAAGNELDADVQVAMAILFNAAEDYAKAHDCFKAALSARPDDWVLYNRVGATLANNGASEDAVSYYYRALELNPAYIRARFNLGISCINLSRYDEAAQHILDALVLQDGDTVHGQDPSGVTTSSLWDSLRVTCLHMQRMDLITFCDSRDLDGIRAALAA